MKLSLITVAVSLSAPIVQALVVPAVGTGLSFRLPSAFSEPESKRSSDNPSFADKLFRRKGGGGSGSRGSGSSSSGSSSSGGSTKGGGSSSNKGGGSSSSNAGGRTTTGSGVSPSYGGGKYYSGGATQPYTSGSKSPSGISPIAVGAIAGASVAGLHYWPGTWYHPIYYYPYGSPYHYYNQSSGRNETKNVGCGCDQTVECSCDDNSNTTYVDDLIGNGSYAALTANGSAVTLGDVNGTETLLINGTLENGTTASGGTESPNAAGGGLRALLQHAGYWPAAATVLAMVFVL